MVEKKDKKSDVKKKPEETPEGEKLEEKSKEPEKPEEPEAPEAPKGVDEILKKSIAEIDAMAKEKGLVPSDYHDQKELAEAIFGAFEAEKPEE